MNKRRCHPGSHRAGRRARPRGDDQDRRSAQILPGKLASLHPNNASL